MGCWCCSSNNEQDQENKRRLKKARGEQSDDDIPTVPLPGMDVNPREEIKESEP